MRRFFGRDNGHNASGSSSSSSRVNYRPTPFLQTGPSNAAPAPASKSAPATKQSWAPTETVANHNDIHELVHRIRFLASMGSEDRPLVLDMCDRASTDGAAREAVKALMHEFKCGTPDAQLSAARLWAILLRNSSVAFIAQSAASDFLDAVAELLVSPRTSPVVRHRVLRVLGDAVWSNPTKEPFKRLWLSVKPPEEPDQGSPYNAHDAILRSPTTRTPARQAQGPPVAADLRFPAPRTHAQMREWVEAPPPSYEFATGTGTALRSSWVYAPSPRARTSATSNTSSHPTRSRHHSDTLSYANTEDFILDISPAHSPTTEDIQLQHTSEVWSTMASGSGSGNESFADVDDELELELELEPSVARSTSPWSRMANSSDSNSRAASVWMSYSLPQSLDGDSMVLDIPALPVPPSTMVQTPVEEWRAGIEDVLRERELVPTTPRRTLRLNAPPKPKSKPKPKPRRSATAPQPVPVPSIAPMPIIRQPFAQTENHVNHPRPVNRVDIGMPATMPTGSSSNEDKAKQAIYSNTLFYLKDVAWNEDESAALIKLSSFSKAISKLSALNSLVFALQYKQLLTQIATDLKVSGQTKLKAALELDQGDIAARVVAVLYSPTEEEAVMLLEDEAAQSFLDIVQFTIDHGALLTKRDATSRARRLISKLSRAADKLPSALIISGVEQRDEHATFCGGFGDVFRAMYQGKPVALKHMRRFHGSDTEQREMRQKFCREALVWQRLKRHPYVVPLIGIDMETFPSSLCLVSPWMRNGTVINYLKGFTGKERRVVVDRLIREIAQGLAFLHDQKVVHGDLRGSNILVDDDGHACLTDFGLTVLSDATTQTTQHGAGSVRWMAPETLNPTACGLDKFVKTTASDIYAFACVCLELYTGFAPFHQEILHDAPVILQVMEGVRPARPTNTDSGISIPDHVWEIMQQSWAHNHADRPTILGIVLELAMHAPLTAASLLDEDEEMPDAQADVEDDVTDDSASTSASGDQPDYQGWVASVILPLDAFIDRSVNPRHRFSHLRQIVCGEESGATVYEAHASDDADEDSFVAIKSIPIVPAGADGANLSRVLHELRVMAHVPPCENILRMDALYVDPVDDALWIRMQLMNRTLASAISLIGAGLRLSDRVIAGCAKDILTALQHLRTHNLALGNLSARNILIGTDGMVKLADFSSAVELSVDLTDHRRSRSISKDAHALGSLVLEMAVGSRSPNSQILHDFVDMCFKPDVDYTHLLGSPFILGACQRMALTQILGQCTIVEMQRGY
ncbi:Kinase-like protein [Mycena chlorophos]|uniref:Kinase-like protein n=1 Tax=Mycena chlorophos TaxID=658473 RepID=A0A8H6SBX4_MYCCL|nr:Kinase-like protein [Mycena chlorophos]